MAFLFKYCVAPLAALLIYNRVNCASPQKARGQGPKCRALYSYHPDTRPFGAIASRCSKSLQAILSLNKTLISRGPLKAKTHGFTLLELLIVLLIVGILAAVAYPVYSSYLTKAHRSDGKIALLNLATAMERYYAENNNSYQGASLAKLQVDAVTLQGFYKLTIAQVTASSYLLHAVPLNSQAKNDALCKTLTLDQLGQRGQTGRGTTQECW